MAGLLNATQGKQGGSFSGSSKIANPQLRQIEQGVEAKVPPELKQMYMSIVVAGMRVMFDKGSAQYMQTKLSNASTVVQTVSADIPKLLLLVSRESKMDKTKDDQQRAKFIGAAMLAGRTLMCQALDYAEQIGGVTMTKDMIDQCTAALNIGMPAAFGITKDMMSQQMQAKGALKPTAGAQAVQSALPQQGA